MQPLRETIEIAEKKPYYITRLSNYNVGDLAILYEAVYGKKVSNYFFHKKYKTAYTGMEHIGFIAYNERQLPIAYYGVIPCFIEYNGSKILAAQSADTMTHPAHRFKGMFVELSQVTFELCRNLGIRLLFGFPNQNSYHGAVSKLGWKLTENMVCFNIPVKALPFQSILSKSQVTKKLYRRVRNHILDKITVDKKGISNYLLIEGFAGIDRKDDYFNYKTYSGTRVIQIAGVQVWIKEGLGLQIGDMDGVDAQNFRPVLKSLKILAMKLGTRSIQFHCSPGILLHKLFSDYFESSPSYPVLFQDFGSPVPVQKIKFTLADLDIF